MNWKRPVRSVVRFGLDRRRIRSVVESELRRRRPGPPIETAAAGRAFVDRHGVRHPLDPTLRGRLKPSWPTMIDPEAVAAPPSDKDLGDRATRAAKVVAEARALVALSTDAPLSGSILEIGCYDGSAAYQLARITGERVVGSDLARYYVIQRPGSPVDADIEAQQGRLAEIRERARVVAGATRGSVEFVEDDITASSLPSGSFDAIVSFEVLEHVRRPEAAFAGMARLLRPGGIVFHDYNPFFSANGGHSLCTLAFPWGHARLDADDFERYLRELRPTEVKQALRFYHESLNRLTHADLRAAIAAAGLELVGLIPWNDRRLVPELVPEVLADVQRLYPSAVLDDLLSTFVAVIARRPPGA